MAPAHVVDMEESVEASEVYKRSEACEAFHHALYGVADLRLREEFIPGCRNQLLKILSAVHYDVLFVF